MASKFCHRDAPARFPKGPALSRLKCAACHRRQSHNRAALPYPARLLRACHSSLRRSSPRRRSAPAWLTPENLSPSRPRVSSLSSYFLRGTGSSVSFKSNLLQLVEQGLVTDLQFLRGPPPVPAGTRQSVQDQFLFRFA